MATHDPTILTIDVGNTSTKLAVFKGNMCLKFERLIRLNVALLKKWIKQYDVVGISYSASGTSDDAIVDFIRHFDHNIILSHETTMPLKIAYKTPQTLGKDRIAAVLGAQALFPNQNVVVIDMGTCITYEVLSADGVYLGGNIAPGISMRLKAMHDYTASLPLLAPEAVTHWIGQSTDEALINGAILGTQMEIESFIGRAKVFLGTDRTKLDNVQLVLTGGDGGFLHDNLQETLQTEIVLEPRLIHIGLYALMKYNFDTPERTTNSL